MRYKALFCIVAVVLSLQTLLSKAQEVRIAYKPFSDNTGHWYSISDKNNMINARPGRPRYKEDQLTQIGDNMLLFQKNNGGWPKNYDFFAILTNDQKDSVSAGYNVLNTTYDNGNTYTQIAALAQIYTATKIDKYKNGVIKGLDFILSSQYKNGGFPQYFPLENNYSRYITYNDGVSEGIMKLLKDILDGDPQYAFVDSGRRNKLKTAFDKGLICILRTQIADNGKLTAWCQQHDEVTLKPAWARKFETASICNGESAYLVLFLMSIDRPKPELINSIQGAVAWFEASKIYNTVVKTIPAERMQTPFRVSVSDRIVVEEPGAKPIWTRYYELETHRPLFCNRDSKVVYSLAEVTRERRDGYGWYTYNPQKVLDNYHEWQIKWAPGNDVLKK